MDVETMVMRAGVIGWAAKQPVMMGHVVRSFDETSAAVSRSPSANSEVAKAAGQDLTNAAVDNNDAFKGRLRCARASYLSASGKSPGTRLVSSAPAPSALGVHMTFDMVGRVNVRTDLHWTEESDYKSDKNAQFVLDLISTSNVIPFDANYVFELIAGS